MSKRTHSTFEQFYQVCEWVKKTYPARDVINKGLGEIIEEFKASVGGTYVPSEATVKKALQTTGRKRARKPQVSTGVSRVATICSIMEFVVSRMRYKGMLDDATDKEYEDIMTALNALKNNNSIKPENAFAELAE